MKEKQGTTDTQVVLSYPPHPLSISVVENKEKHNMKQKVCRPGRYKIQLSEINNSSRDKNTEILRQRRRKQLYFTLTTGMIRQICKSLYSFDFRVKPHKQFADRFHPAAMPKGLVLRKFRVWCLCCCLCCCCFVFLFMWVCVRTDCVGFG